jgi:hypothetical protein
MSASASEGSEFVRWIGSENVTKLLDLSRREISFGFEPRHAIMADGPKHGPASLRAAKHVGEIAQ